MNQEDPCVYLPELYGWVRCIDNTLLHPNTSEKTLKKSEFRIDLLRMGSFSVLVASDWLSEGFWIDKGGWACFHSINEGKYYKYPPHKCDNIEFNYWIGNGIEFKQWWKDYVEDAERKI